MQLGSLPLKPEGPCFVCGKNNPGTRVEQKLILGSRYLGSFGMDQLYEQSYRFLYLPACRRCAFWRRFFAFIFPLRS